MKTVHEIVREAEQQYTTGSVKLGDYVEFSMHDTIETIDAYLNSKHISGPKDSLNRDKPFFNIVTAAVNIWYRATDIDRKDIRFVPTKTSSIVLAFVANVLLQNWMDKARFGVFLNQWGRALARYGSAVAKFVERDGELLANVLPWNRLIVDQVDYYSLPRIEKLYKTPAQLKAMAIPGSPDYAGYDLEQVKALVDTITTRKTLKRQPKDNQPDFIELYEVSGVMDSRLLEDEPDESVEDEDITYKQQIHIISFVGRDTKDGFDDFTLYRGRERKRTDMLTHLIEEDGRTLAIGAVEHLFEAQWMTNHSVKNMKDTLDLVSKVIFQTADPFYVGRNVLSAIEVGDILTHEEGKPLTLVNNQNASIVALQNFGTMWQSLARDITSTPEAIRGQTLPSGTPYALGAYLGSQANSLFEIMTENKGLAIEDMMREYVIPFLKKQLKNKDEIVGILDDAGIREIDSIYIPAEAVRRYNKRATEEVLNGAIPSPFVAEMEQNAIRQELGSLGNKRFFKPDELGKKQWAEIFSDFEWDNIRVEVTNEQVDKQAVLTTLSSVLQTIAANPAILQDPNAKMIFNQILAETGRLSPLQLSTQPAPAPQASGGVEAISKLAEAEPNNGRV